MLEALIKRPHWEKKLRRDDDRGTIGDEEGPDKPVVIIIGL